MSSARRYATTVLGPRELRPGGLIDAHGHVWNSPPAGGPDDAPVLIDEPAMEAELAAFHDAGGLAVIDCQPPDVGRDARRLARLAEASGVALIAATGFHLRRYYPPGESVWTARGDVAHDRFAAELADGMVEDGMRLEARAGVVKAAHSGVMDAETERLLAAATAAAAGAGALLVIHTERGGGVEQLVEFLFGLGMSAQDIMLSHVDKRADLGLHRELARAGFLLEYDTFLRPQYVPQERAWPLVMAMLEHGHEASIACGLDLADHSMWRFGGHPAGMLGLHEVVIPGLRERGASPREIELLTGGNVAARLGGGVVAEAA